MRVKHDQHRRPFSVRYDVAAVTSAPQLAQFPADGTIPSYTPILGHAMEFQQAGRLENGGAARAC
jgi:20S proteasome alpha/beta subunit